MEIDDASVENRSVQTTTVIKYHYYLFVLERQHPHLLYVNIFNDVIKDSMKPQSILAIASIQLVLLQHLAIIKGTLVA